MDRFTSYFMRKLSVILDAKAFSIVNHLIRRNTTKLANILIVSMDHN